MKKLFLFLLLVPLSVGAQTFFPMRKGAVLEYKYRDAKGKILKDEWRKERFLRFMVEEVWGDTVANVVVENEQLARLKNNQLLKQAIEQIGYGDVRVTGDGVVFDNMTWVTTGVPAMFKSMPETLPENTDYWKKYSSPYAGEVRAVSVLPARMAVGDSLPDERHEVFYNEQLTDEVLKNRSDLQQQGANELQQYMDADERMPDRQDMVIRAYVRKRRVEGREKVGGYDCWKISYELVGPTEELVGLPRRLHELIMKDADPVVTRYVDYVSPEVGLVKREKLNFRGNKPVEVLVLESVR